MNADVELMVRIGSAVLNAAQSLSILTGAPVDDAMLLSVGAKLFPDVDNGAYSPRERDLSCVSFARWIENGLPVVEMGHKFAAALLVSNITPETLQEVRRPWSSFLINVPDGLIFLQDKELRHVPVRRVLVGTLPGKRGDWCYVAQANNGVAIWRYGCTPDLLLPPHTESAITNYDIEMTDVDGAAQVLVGRLIVNTCAAMSMPDMVEETGRGHATHSEARKKKQKPPLVPRMFKVGKPVQMDFRDRVRSFTSGEREASQIEVRTLVRGHFKRQHYGPGNSLIKTIWREPFWRGPDDAAVVVRPHVLKGDDE